MIKAFAYSKKDNTCVLKVNNIVKVEDVGDYIRFVDASGNEHKVEKKPYKVRVYHN